MILLDNASPNRALLKSLLNNFSQTSFADPNDSARRIFAIFDPVHNVKNIYNNFQVRKNFVCPAIPFTDMISPCTANFYHIEELYKKEIGMPLKIAHKLNPKVLNPFALEKTSVKLSLAVFDDTTSSALDFYSNTIDSWKETSAFIKYITSLWKILNVKTPTIGAHKRDSFRFPIYTCEDSNLLFLKSLLNGWKSGKKVDKQV